MVKAHRLLNHSTLGSRVMKKKKEAHLVLAREPLQPPSTWAKKIHKTLPRSSRGHPPAKVAAPPPRNVAD